MTTHVLDTELGRPGAGIAVELYRIMGEAAEKLGEVTTNHDGRTDAAVIEGDAFLAGVYELRFHVGAYLRRAGRTLPDPAFLDVVTLRFGVAAPDEHFHVPLLLQTHGYSTYRGS